MIEQLISRVFYARNLAHFAHWRAKGDGSFARHIKWIEEHHEDICQGNRAVANLIDTLTGVYLSAIYKLRNLK